MIYLLRKHDIISVPSYAAGIYHRTKCDIISKIYHPFRQERISLKKALAFASAFFMAEEKGFEPLQRFHALRDFESRLFDQLEYSSIAEAIIPAVERKSNPFLADSKFAQDHRPVMAARTSISMGCIFLIFARPSSMSTSVKPPTWVQTMRLVLPASRSWTAR